MIIIEKPPANSSKEETIKSEKRQKLTSPSEKRNM